MGGKIGHVTPTRVERQWAARFSAFEMAAMRNPCGCNAAPKKGNQGEDLVGY
jgi:hypothetical protein